jgi:hypothetical protein
MCLFSQFPPHPPPPAGCRDARYFRGMSVFVTSAMAYREQLVWVSVLQVGGGETYGRAVLAASAGTAARDAGSGTAAGDAGAGTAAGEAGAGTAAEEAGAGCSTEDRPACNP